MDKNLYIHLLEENLLKTMMESTYFSEEVMDYYKNFDEKLRKPDLLGKTVKVTNKQFKEIHNIVVKIASDLEMKVPDTYIYEDFYYGVESKGANEPWLEISAKTLLDLSKKELMFLISREMCNIKLKHTYNYTLIEETLKAMQQNNNIIGADVLAEALKITMYKYSRVANYTADCFGYLMCKDLKVCSKAILKLVLNNVYLSENVNISEYISQAQAINELDDNIYNFTKMDELVPYGPFRIKNLLSYAVSERGLEAIKKSIQFISSKDLIEGGI